MNISVKGYSRSAIKSLTVVKRDSYLAGGAGGLTIPNKFCVGSERSRLVPERSCLVPERSCVAPERSCLVPERSCLAPEKSCLGPDRSCVAPEKSLAGNGMETGKKILRYDLTESKTCQSYFLDSLI